MLTKDNGNAICTRSLAWHRRGLVTILMNDVVQDNVLPGPEAPAADVQVVAPRRRGVFRAGLATIFNRPVTSLIMCLAVRNDWNG